MSKNASRSLVTTTALVLASALNFLSLVLWTYVLTPTQFGIYALISASVLQLNASFFEWMRLTLARLIYDRNDPFEISVPVTNAYAAIAIFIAAVLLSFVLSVQLLSDSLFGIEAHWWFGIWGWLVSETLFSIISTINRIRLKAWHFFSNMVGRALLSLSIAYPLVVWADLGAAGVVIGIVAAQSIAVVVSALVDPAIRRVRPTSLDFSHIRSFLRFGLPLIFSTSVGYAAYVADRFIVAHQLGIAEAGHYSVAVDFMQKTILFFMLAINLTTYPALVRTYEDAGPEAGRKHLQRNFTFYLMIGGPAAAGIAVLAPGISVVAVGPQFRDTVTTLLPLLAVAAVLRGLTTFSLSVALQMAKLTRQMIVAPTVCLAVVVPASFVGAAISGVEGVAVASLGAQGVSFLASQLIVKQRVGLRIVTGDTIFLLCASVAMALALWPMRNYTHPLQTIGLVVTGTTLYGLLVSIYFRKRLATFGLRVLGKKRNL